jgi:HAD superfamily hydrolase (TIGR01549 family)
MADTSFVTKAIVFDFDGVITTLEIDWDGLRKQISSKLGLNIQAFAEFFETSYETEKFYEVSDMVRQCEQIAAEKAILYPDVPEALDLLQESKGIQCYIASMQSIEVLDCFLKEHSLLSRFVGILGRENGGSKKAQLKQIMQSVEHEARNIAFFLIDDSSINVMVAMEMGYEAIFFRRKQSAKSLVDLVGELIYR